MYAHHLNMAANQHFPKTSGLNKKLCEIMKVILRIRKL